MRQYPVFYYGHPVEDDRHLFSCRFPREVWHNLQKGNKLIHLPALSLKDLICHSFLFHKGRIVVFATAFWLILYARNKLKYEGVNFIGTTIALQVLDMEEKCLSLSQPTGNHTSSALAPNVKKCTTLEYGTLKVNIDVVFTKEKIGIGVLVRNHLCALLLTQVVPCNGCYIFDYGVLLGIIEGYIVGLQFSESYYLRVTHS